MSPRTERPKPRSTPGGSRLRRVCPSLRQVRTVVALLLASFIVEACGPSSPRFGNGNTDGGETSRRKSPRFSREAHEERKEDDKKPDPKTVGEVLSGTRDFRTEKNPAITPLDQSRIMRAISKYMGVPYQYGGADSKGMDCSGYTLMVFKESIGRPLPRSVEEQYRVGIPVPFNSLKFGDLVFFNTTGSTASHVGIYLGDNLFAHASVSLGVTISSLESSYYKTRYTGARRIITGAQ